MAVALILAADTQENVVVVGRVAVAQHIRRRTESQTASVITSGYYRDVFFFFLNLYLSGGRFAERAHVSALHPDDYTWLFLRLDNEPRQEP